MAEKRVIEMYSQITLLGNSQDAGRPQLGCGQKCCEDARADYSLVRHPVSLGLHGEKFGIVEVTRCISYQTSMVGNPEISDIWLTHAHLGHIEGLGQFGKEALNSRNVKLHCSDSVSNYIFSHPLWRKLFERGNIGFDNFTTDYVIPVEVPHRAKDFDTYGLLFKGQSKNLFFLPDHDSWEETLRFVAEDNPLNWFKSLEADIVLLDGTFWDEKELQDRPQNKVSHPTVKNTLELVEKRDYGHPRIVFVHFNHTNPLHYPDSSEFKKVIDMGWEIGEEGMEFSI